MPTFPAAATAMLVAVMVVISDGIGSTPAARPTGEIAITQDFEGLSTIHPDGRGLRRLVAVGDRAALDPAVWSPDGRWIVYGTNDDVPKTGACWRSDRPGCPPALFVMSAAGGRPKATGSGAFDPSWAHDSTRLAYSQGLAKGGRRLQIVNRDGIGGGEGFGRPTHDSWRSSTEPMAAVRQAAFPS